MNDHDQEVHDCIKLIKKLSDSPDNQEYLVLNTNNYAVSVTIAKYLRELCDNKSYDVVYRCISTYDIENFVQKVYIICYTSEYIYSIANNIIQQFVTGKYRREPPEYIIDTDFEAYNLSDRLDNIFVSRGYAKPRWWTDGSIYFVIFT